METAGSLVSGAVVLLVAYMVFFDRDDKVLDRIIIGVAVVFVFVVSMMMAVAALFVS